MSETPSYSEALQRLEAIVAELERGGTDPVSYTHLTLPTTVFV